MRLLQTARAMLFSPAGIYFGALLVSRAGAILLIPLYTRRLTVEEYGDYALAQTVVMLLPTLLTFGMIAAVARFYFDGQDSAQGILRSGAAAKCLAMTAVGGAAAIQAAVLLTAPVGAGVFSRWELSCLLWAGAGGALAAVPATILRATQRSTLAALFQFAQLFTLITSGILLVAVMGRGLRGSIEAMAIASVIDGIVGLVFIATALKGTPTRRLYFEALRFSLPFVPHYFGNQLQLIADRWTLKGGGFQAELGRYALASQLSAPVSMATIAWNDAEAPQVGEMFRQGGIAKISSKFRSIQRAYLFASGATALLVILGIPVIALVVGSSFAPAFWVVPALCLIGLIEALYFPNNLVVFFAGRTHVIPAITISAGIANVALNLVLIPFLGAWGAVIARALSASYRSGAMMWFARACFRDADHDRRAVA